MTALRVAGAPSRLPHWVAADIDQVGVDGYPAHGAPAEFVVYDRDPLADLSVLDRPAHVVLNGRLVHRS